MKLKETTTNRERTLTMSETETTTAAKTPTGAGKALLYGLLAMFAGPVLALIGAVLLKMPGVAIGILLWTGLGVAAVLTGLKAVKAGGKGGAIAGILTGVLGVLGGLGSAGLLYSQATASLEETGLDDAEKALQFAKAEERGYGNTPEAVELARTMAGKMEAYCAEIPGGPGTTSIWGDTFSAYGYLGRKSAAFVFTVPNLKKYTSEAKEEISKAAWAEAQSLAAAAGMGAGVKLAVAPREGLGYGPILIGQVVSDFDPSAEPLAGVKNEAGTEKDLERLFR